MDNFLTASLGAPAGAVVADWTRSSGADLDHPLAAGRVVVLDEEGNDTWVVIGELLDLLESGRDPVAFQAWFSSESDMVVTSKESASRGQRSIVSFFLDGLDESMRVEVVSRLQSSFHERAQDLLGYAHVSGDAADLDWDSFMVNPAVPVPPGTQLLVLSMAHAGAMRWGEWSLNVPVPGLMTLQA